MIMSKDITEDILLRERGSRKQTEMTEFML